MHTHMHRKWQPSPVFLPGKFHGQRSLAGYSPSSREKLDVTEHAHTHTHAYTHRILSTFLVYRLEETSK